MLRGPGVASKAIHIAVIEPTLPDEAQGGAAWATFEAKRAAVQAHAELNWRDLGRASFGRANARGERLESAMDADFHC